MFYSATVNYLGGHKGTTEVEVREEHDGFYIEPFIAIGDELLLDGVIRENSDDLLTNYGRKLTDGWQAIHRNDVESIVVGPYTWRPQMTTNELAHRDMLAEIERAFR